MQLLLVRRVASGKRPAQAAGGRRAGVLSRGGRPRRQPPGDGGRHVHRRTYRVLPPPPRPHCLGRHPHGPRDGPSAAHDGQRPHRRDAYGGGCGGGGGAGRAGGGGGGGVPYAAASRPPTRSALGTMWMGNDALRDGQPARHSRTVEVRAGGRPVDSQSTAAGPSTAQQGPLAQRGADGVGRPAGVAPASRPPAVGGVSTLLIDTATAPWTRTLP